MRFVLSTLLLVAGCAAAPLPVHRQDLVLGQVVQRYRAFYPSDGDPDPARDAGVLRPRFGLPAIAAAGAAFPVELLERGGPSEVRGALVQSSLPSDDAERCLHGEPVDGCYPIAWTPFTRESLGAATVARAQATTGAPAGGYDLYLHSACDAPTRSKAWLNHEPSIMRPSQFAFVDIATVYANILVRS